MKTDSCTCPRPIAQLCGDCGGLHPSYFKRWQRNQDWLIERAGFGATLEQIKGLLMTDESEPHGNG